MVGLAWAAPRSAADAVIVGSKIIRRDIGTDNNRCVGGKAANPTVAWTASRASHILRRDAYASLRTTYMKCDLSTGAIAVSSSHASHGAPASTRWIGGASTRLR